MMKIILAVCLILSFISLMTNIFLWIKINNVSKKRKELRHLVERIKDDVTRYLNNHNDRLVRLEFKAKQSSNITQQSNHNPVQQPIQQSTQQASDNCASSKPEKKQSKKNHEKGHNRSQQPITIKTIYLGINSEDMFFEMEEQKSESSKFVAELTSESEGTFRPIDVERIRAANVTASMKQYGVVSIKDAQSFNVVEPGKILRKDDAWHIERPAIIEFIK